MTESRTIKRNRQVELWRTTESRTIRTRQLELLRMIELRTIRRTRQVEL
jgi:hypothetical protein